MVVAVIVWGVEFTDTTGDLRSDLALALLRECDKKRKKKHEITMNLRSTLIRTCWDYPVGCGGSQMTRNLGCPRFRVLGLHPLSQTVAAGGWISKPAPRDRS